MIRSPLRAVGAAALLAPALILASCSGDAGAPEEQGAPDPDASLRVGLVLEPTNLDIRHTAGAALEQLLIDNVYEGLVTRTAENEVVPSLATEWEVADDGLTYTFTLAEGVLFHDGAELTASDAAASIADVVEDESLIGHSELAEVTSVTAPDDTTVVIELEHPDQNLLFSLSGPAGLVLDEDDDTDMQTAANGTGPFALQRWNQGDSVVLTRNDDYHGEQAGVAEVVLSYIADFTAGVNAALAGDVDVLTAVDPQLAPQLEEAGGFTLTRGKTTDKYILGFNNAEAPLDDPRVREALRLAIDHDGLISAVGAGAPQYGPIPELDPGYEDLSDLVPFDQARAKELLADAGQEDLSLELTIPSFYGTTISAYLVSEFHDIGVDLRVNRVEFATWLQDVYTNGDYQLSVVNHVEPRDFAAWTDPEYYFHYDSEEVQDLYAQAMETTDEAESAELLAQAARIVSGDHAADWLYTATAVTAVGSGVAGFPVDSINSRLPLAQVTLAG